MTFYQGLSAHFLPKTVVHEVDKNLCATASSTFTRATRALEIGHLAIGEKHDILKFPTWFNAMGRDAREDPLMKLLVEKYRGEHESRSREHEDAILKLEHDIARRITRAILDLSRAHELRFVSFNRRDFLSFENVRKDHWPVIWRVADRLPAGWRAGCGNTEQAQISIPANIPFVGGVYHLGQLLPEATRLRMIKETGRPYVHLAPALDWDASSGRAREKPYTGKTMRGVRRYMEACGVTTGYVGIMG